MAWFEIRGTRLYKPYSEGATIFSETESDAIEKFKEQFPDAQIGEIKVMKGQCGQICHLNDNGELIKEAPLPIDTAICNAELRNDGFIHGKTFFIFPITL